MTCLDARKKIYDYLNNKLTDAELKDFIDHVNGCDECMDELRITHMVYRGAAELDSDVDTNLNIDEALKKTISDSKFYLFRLFSRRIAAMVVDTIAFWAVLIIFIMQIRMWIM